MGELKRAAIDVGSNAVLLLAAEKRGDSWQALQETSEVTGLGEGTKQTGLLGEQGMERTLAAVKRAWLKAEELGISEIRAMATMAARIASNVGEFLQRADAQGTPIEVLSGEDEAELSFRSAAEDPLFANSPTVSVIDIGGQSTEIVVACREPGGWRRAVHRSFPVGTLGLRSQYFPEERCTGPQLLQASAGLDELLGFCLLPFQCGTVVALGASATNLITIREKIDWNPEIVHGASLDYEEISRAVGWLSPMSNAERAAVPGLEAGREGTIHLGALILERSLFALRGNSCRVSIRGWRYALLADDSRYR